jgi:hypothetical protein
VVSGQFLVVSELVPLCFLKTFRIYKYDTEELYAVSKEKYGENFPWKKDNSYHRIQIAPGLVIV